MPPFAPSLGGNTKHAYVVATNAPSFPVTIDGTHLTWKFNSVEYTIPTGTYANISDLRDAVNLSTGGSGATLANAVIKIDISRSDPTKLIGVSVIAGAITQAFAAGVTGGDALARLGFTAQSLAGGEPLD